MISNELLHRVFWGNPLSSYLWCFGILLFGILFRHLISKLLAWIFYFILRNYSHKDIGYKKFQDLVKKPFGLFIAFLTIYIAFSQLNFPVSWKLAPVDKLGIRMVLDRSMLSLIIMSFTWIILRMVDYGGLVFMHHASLTESKFDDHIIPFIKETVKIIILIFSLFTLLGAVFKLDITSLIAGLGIGGLAIALAAKESLENLLASFTIFFDKPFILGDLIKVGDIEGNVEKIGFRSTRIRTLEKSFVTVPNKKLVDTELDNLSNRMIRRVKFDIGLPFDTPLETLKNIIQEIKTAVESDPLVTEEVSVFFFEINNSAYSVRIIYFANTPVWKEYMEMRERVNNNIIEIISTHKVQIAYNTHSVHIESTGNENKPS